MIFEGARGWVLLATMCQLASCQSRQPRDDVAIPSTPCPSASAPVRLTESVRAQFAPIEFGLPIGAFQAHVFEDEVERGEAWTGSSGLVVSYAVRSEPTAIRGVSRGDHDVVNCAEWIGGRTTAIRMVYSTATTAPGQRVIAVWRLDHGESLVITAFHPDQRHRDELL